VNGRAIRIFEPEKALIRIIVLEMTRFLNPECLILVYVLFKKL